MLRGAPLTLIILTAGSGRLGKSCRLISKAGYPSCLLKHDISPPSQRVELSKLSAFWTLALQSLGRKSSSQFGGFRSKIAVGLKDDVPMQWYKVRSSEGRKTRAESEATR